MSRGFLLPRKCAGDHTSMSVAILGLAAYPRNQVWHNVEMLVRSARRNSPRTHVMLLTAPLGDADQRLFDRYDVEVIDRVDQPPPVRKTPESREDRVRWILELYGRRHALYQEVIESHQFSHVLLTDTRDVIVTADLEERGTATRLVLSQEDSSLTVSAEPCNRRWVLGGYGEAGLAAFGAKPILCAGTVFGPRQDIVGYLRAMAREVDRIGVDKTRRIGDQPLHNYLAYAGMLPEYVISAAEDGWMRSIGAQQFKAVVFDWDPIQRPREVAAPCSIVHQYDRHLAHRAMRHAVARVAGLQLLHPWRMEAYRDHGRDLGSRVLRRIAHTRASMVDALTRR